MATFTVGDIKFYSTFWAEAKYGKVTAGCWRFFVDGHATGPYYPTQQLLMVDMRRWGTEYGFEAV